MFALAWYLRRDDASKKNVKHKKISIIVAFRNEEKNIKKLIESLVNQDYGNYEIILVNDHSDDNSVQIINENASEKMKLFNLPVHFSSKKQALRYGAERANGEYFFFIDADCVASPCWLKETFLLMDEKKIEMLCGPVEFFNNPNLFSKLAQLEFLSMTGSGAAGIFLNSAFMCNGANYAIKNDVFFEASKHFNDKYSSGDDVFLLHYVSKKYKVDFAKNENCIIKTEAPKNIKDLFRQRVRWASKTSGYRTFASILTVLLTFLMSFILIVSIIAGIFEQIFLAVFAGVFIVKFFVDTILMIPILSFHKKKYLILFMPLLQIFYPFYIVATGVLSLFWQPQWKGRKISS
ncbi:glycosyltransferase [Bacteroidales bacterium OttesenSCG-928-I21]|nr:glycosyltransferase [Bacteroidales bacterium OttesenSCG-928-I21]